MNRSVLNKATKDDENPPQGWMYHSIIKMVNTSDSTSRRVRDWLFRRLKQNSPRVKKKVLLIIKNICENGSPDFAINIAHTSTHVIKEYVSYKGKRDDLHGDALNKEVRELAKETVASIYQKVEGTNRRPPSISNKSTVSSTSSYHEGRNNNIVIPTGRVGKYQGFGSGGSSSAPSSPYMGISNPLSGEKCTRNPLKERLGIKNTCQCSKCRKERSTSKYTGISSRDTVKGDLISGEYSTHGSDDFYGAISSPNATHSFNSGYVPPSVGGNSSYYSSSSSSSSSSSHRNTPKRRNQFNNLELDENEDDYEDEEGGNGDLSSITEKRVVDKLCGGTQSSRISKGELIKFVESVKTVNQEKIAEYLHEKLGKKQLWKVKLKSLSGINVLLQQKNSAISNVIQDYFLQNKDAYDRIQKLTSAPQNSVRKKADKTIKLLSGGNDGEGESSSSITTNTEKKNSSSLLNFGEGQGKSSKGDALSSFLGGESNNNNNNNNNEGGGSMFEGMEMKGDDDEDDEDEYEEDNYKPKEEQKGKDSSLFSFFGEKSSNRNDGDDFGKNMERKLQKKVDERRRKSQKLILENFNLDSMFANEKSNSGNANTSSNNGGGDLSSFFGGSGGGVNNNVPTSSPNRNLGDFMFTSQQKSQISPPRMNPVMMFDDDLLNQPVTRMRVKKTKLIKNKNDKNKQDSFAKLTNVIKDVDF